MKNTITLKDAFGYAQNGNFCRRPQPQKTEAEWAWEDYENERRKSQACEEARLGITHGSAWARIKEHAHKMAK